MISQGFIKRRSVIKLQPIIMGSAQIFFLFSFLPLLFPTLPSLEATPLFIPMSSSTSSSPSPSITRLHLLLLQQMANSESFGMNKSYRLLLFLPSRPSIQTSSSPSASGAIRQANNLHTSNLNPLHLGLKMLSSPYLV